MVFNRKTWHDNQGSKSKIIALHIEVHESTGCVIDILMLSGRKTFTNSVTTFKTMFLKEMATNSTKITSGEVITAHTSTLRELR